VSEIIEATTPEQLEQVRSLFREYQAELPFEYCFRYFDTELSQLPGEYAPPKGKLLLAIVAGQPVGCAGLRPFPLEGAGEMKRLYLRPAFRGAKLGKVLADRIVTEARALGYTRLRLDTHPPSMLAAVRMYQKMGFREVVPDATSRVEGLVYMEMVLQPAQMIKE
jgi:putative acetyltransferase